MIPRRMAEADQRALGPEGSGIEPLPFYRNDGAVRSIWTLDDEERAAVAAGAPIELAVQSGEDIFPVSLIVRTDLKP